MFVCVACGKVEKGLAIVCPSCGSVMKSEEGLSHGWVGRAWPSQPLMLSCRDKNRVAFMDYDIANEIPYCPFCRREIEYRPKNIQDPDGLLL